MALETGPNAGATDRRRTVSEPSETNGQVAIEVRDLEKVFRIPSQRTSRLKERLANPFRRQQYRQLHALRSVSFDIHSGEFFGILGRNGSGKSTLLKIMASIYRADEGRVRMAGTVSPFIELGVGFDVELSARENVLLNAVMMGMTPNEARRRIDAVVEFAELEDFSELKLKNYSSGMLVRLAFSVMIQADTDILLIDEVLAVGDAAFQQKCADVFRQLRKQGKTIVFVTHDLAAVHEYCHRAMLLDEGRLVEIGKVEKVTQRYLRLNFERHVDQPADIASDSSEDMRILDIWLEGPDGTRLTNLEQGEQIRLRALLEANREVSDPEFGFVIANADDVNVHEFLAPLPASFGPEPRLVAGQRVTVSLDARNTLLPGHYYVHHGAARNRNRPDTAFWAPHVLGFIVYGSGDLSGIVTADHEMTVAAEEPETR